MTEILSAGGSTNAKFHGPNVLLLWDAQFGVTPAQNSEFTANGTKNWDNHCFGLTSEAGSFTAAAGVPTMQASLVTVLNCQANVHIQTKYIFLVEAAFRIWNFARGGSQGTIRLSYHFHTMWHFWGGEESHRHGELHGRTVVQERRTSKKVLREKNKTKQRGPSD